MPNVPVAISDRTEVPTAGPSRHPRRKPLTGGPLALSVVAGATSWFALFQLRLSRVPEGIWIARDDAVITLSHALNWARFGSIGVSPGDRVEGFSSPLQLAVSAVVFRVVRLGYQAFLELFVTTCVVLMGVLAALAIYFASLSFRNGRSRSTWLAVILAGFVAIATLSTWTTAGWIVSGMENPLVIVTGFAVVVFALSASVGRTNTVGAILALTMLGMARVEFAAFIAPVVVAVALVQGDKAPAAERRLIFLLTLAIPLVLLVQLHIARRVYFGVWLPNTALVQGRAQGRDQVILLACLSAPMLAALLPRVARVVGVPSRVRLWLQAVTPIMVVGFTAVAVWMTVAGRSKGQLGILLRLPALLVLGAAVLVLLRLVSLVDRRSWVPNFVFGGLVLIPLGQFLVMGPARLENFRVASMAIPFLALWVAVLAARLITLGWPRRHERAPDGARRAGWMIVPVAVLLIACLAWTESRDGPRYLPFAIGDSEELLGVAHRVRLDELGGVGLPVLANPDLGKISFQKQVLMVDLGLLGDPVLTQIAIHRRDLEVTYLNEVAAPDVIESHGTWSCRFNAWLRSERFQARWKLSDDRWLARKPFNSQCTLDGRYAVWVRADATREYALTRRIATSAKPDSVVRSALSECGSTGNGPFRCQYVRRAVYRVTQDLKSRGRLDEVLSALKGSPSGPLDVQLVERGPDWGRRAFQAFTELADGNL